MDSTELVRTGTTLPAESLPRMSWSIQRQTQREIELVAKRAIVTNAHEEARAQLCQAALLNAGMLSALEEHLIQVSPLGSSRYQGLVDAYVIGAAKQLMQW
jgi:hypothetical protein